jgi:preprotein translocase subunit Sec61beta
MNERLGWPAAILLAVVTIGAAVAAASRDEYDVKAAFLLNFARLVEWPPRVRPAAGEPLVFGIQGSLEVTGAIANSLEGAEVEGHPVSVKRITDPSDVAGCHLLFVAADDAESDPALLAEARGNAALSVGERSDFVGAGGVINFFTEDKKLRFEINPRAAKSAGLRISSRLLRLARLVEGGS